MALSSSSSSSSEPPIMTVPPTQETQSTDLDSINGKTCHQCRQKIKDLFAHCKNLKGNKQCLIKLCHKCLLNRYAEKVEEVALLSDWKCPKCRGFCNCSVCRKRRGQIPTGILAPRAKKSGFASVSEMLNIEGAADNLDNPDKVLVVATPKKRGKENSQDIDNCKLKSPKTLGKGLKEMTIGNEGEVSNSSKDSSKRPKISNETSDGVNHETNDQEVVAKPKPKRGRPKKEKVKDEQVKDVPLPQGANLSSVAGIEIPTESIGHALQFLEFCGTFGEALDLRRGRAESVLREIVQGQDKRRCHYSSTVQFHIQLLQLIQQEPPTMSSKEAEISWLEACGKCLSESTVPMASFPSTFDDYAKLAPMEKLTLLNFLCDEALSTAYMRGWIDDANAKFANNKKESRQKALAAKHKEKCLKLKLQDEEASATANMASNDPASVSEHEAAVARIKDEAAQAHAQVLEAMATVPSRGENCAALRTEPLLLDDNDGNGRIFWKLRHCADAPEDLLLQDIGAWDAFSPREEKWVAYDPEQKPEVEKYISSKKLRSHRKRKYKEEVSDHVSACEGEVAADPVIIGEGETNMKKEVVDPIIASEGEVADPFLAGEGETKLI